MDDPSRPDARVTHGPSCRPGGVLVEVTAGTAPYAVRLATTREPAGEDSAELQPGEVVVLATGEVDWGETIDPLLEFAALDGSGVRYVDDLDGFDFTRPAEADCAAITPPTGAAQVPDIGTPQAGADAEVVPMPVPGLPDPDAALPVGRVREPAAAVASTGRVVAGEEVTLRGRGFVPGERVAVRLQGGAVLSSVTAGPDGQVVTAVRIPAGTAAGSATVELIGKESTTTAAVGLEVAGGGVPWPLLTAGLALLVAGAGVGAASGRRVRRPVGGPPMRSA
ncbi:hypothetical protein [Geodermatophilus ruber]|uniref:Uncharacterized protein n=1 Tax=Geodermatophilus ruber TaxID=504800 RepID=A0A1I4DFT5_9ACTN|nr:hypothetical protein [Geodermatophilus ruber]SFK91347.1 hypothetical protein SAMN04488085_104327 [Geodermatophilus ruber]